MPFVTYRWLNAKVDQYRDELKLSGTPRALTVVMEILDENGKAEWQSRRHFDGHFKIELKYKGEVPLRDLHLEIFHTTSKQKISLLKQASSIDLQDPRTYSVLVDGKEMSVARLKIDELRPSGQDSELISIRIDPAPQSKPKFRLRTQSGKYICLGSDAKELCE
jgi:hypothetical protein